MHEAIKNFIRPHYQGMDGYVSAGMETGKDESLVFMNANEGHYVLPELQGYNFYPEPQPLKLIELMADAYGVETSQIVATRGADESLGLLTKIFCEPHKDAIVISEPAFGMYAVNADSAPVKTYDVPLIKSDDGFALDKDGIIAKAQSDDVKLVYICSPNNPTAGSFPHSNILEIVKAVDGHAVVVLDEAYAEFSQQGSLSGELQNCPNLIILRTLSKAYALAGVRMGATLCDDSDFIDLMKSKVLDTYPLPRPAIEAALIALAPANRAQIKQNIQSCLAERDRLKEFFEISELVTKVYSTDANFMLIEVVDVKAIWQHCYDNGFVLRDFSHKPETANCLRISPATAELNDKFMEVFKAYKLA